MLRKPFLFFLLVKLALSTIFIFVWVSPFSNLNSFFNCSIEAFDSLRYNHDAYVFATGKGEYFGEAFKNFFSVLLGGILYKTFFLHPWIITLFNTAISTVSTWILYKSLQPILTQRRIKEIFFLCQFTPSVIAYESLLGKEVFYLAGYKLIFAICAYLFFSNTQKRWLKIILMLLLLLFISIIRPILIPGLVLAIGCYYLKPKIFIPAAIVSATLAMVLVFAADYESLKEINETIPSSNPIMQALRTFFITDSPIFNLFGGFFRVILYITYPFPLIFPNIIGYYNIPTPEGKCGALLTIVDQLSFWWQLFLIWLIHKTPSTIFSKIQLNAIKYFFYVNLGLLIFFSYSYTLIHARYRIFFFIMFFSMFFLIKKQYKLFLKEKQPIA